jgi:hypothetical protein
VDEVKLHAEQVVLSPAMWGRYKSKRGLKWTKVRFDETSTLQIPLSRGLYAFVVSPPAEDFPPSNWLFYIGEVGAKGGEGRTLRARFNEYLGELTRMTRPKVATYLNRYDGHIDFYYCELDWKAHPIKLIESKLITALWPDANRADWEVEFRTVRAAFS